MGRGKDSKERGRPVRKKIVRNEDARNGEPRPGDPGKRELGNRNRGEEGYLAYVKRTPDRLAEDARKSMHQRDHRPTKTADARKLITRRYRDDTFEAWKWGKNRRLEGGNSAVNIALKRFFIQGNNIFQTKTAFGR